MVTKNRKKKSGKFHCQDCDFTTSDKKDWRRHISTPKHAFSHNGNIDGNSYMCGLCGKKYKYRSGLSRHKKTCKEKKTAKNRRAKMKVEKKNVENPCSELVVKLLKQQQEMQEQIIDLCKNRKIINYNNCNNKKMTINVFLNEQCKDAMNFTEFIENVKVSLEDLEYTNEHGYVKGISNIFEKHLIEMKPTERPIHCSDKKRLQFYVKDENIWKKDAAHEKIDESIKDITMKQIKQLREWENQNPNYLKSEKLLMEWHNMVRIIMGGSEDNTIAKNKEQIKKSLGNTIELKQAMEKDE